jgi:hypothetical protein
MIANYLRLILSHEQIQTVDQRCRRETLSKVVDEFDKIPETDIYRDERYTYHRPTLLHRTHFRAPDAPDWQQLITPDQLTRLGEIKPRLASLFSDNGVRIEPRSDNK